MTSEQQRTSKTKLSDTQLLEAAVRLLECGTFHDNRYGQMSEVAWQESACNVAKQINERLGRARYADVGNGGGKS